MKRCVIWMVGLMLGLLAIGSVVTYQWGGLEEYLRAKQLIGKLNDGAREEAQTLFRGGYGENEYSGIVGVINPFGYGGVMVWGLDGPKYFAADQYSVFSTWNGCKDGKPALTDSMAQGSRSISRDVVGNIKEWKSGIEGGELVVVKLATEAHGGEVGKLREALAYDWWYFVPGGMEVQCAR